MDTPTALVWAHNEFCDADLGDTRRCKRATRIAAGLLCNVGSAISSSCGGGGAQAVSRFFECKGVTEESILSGHNRRIMERCKGYNGRILVAQDTTALDYEGRTNISLGPLAFKNGNAILMHSALVMSEDRVPIGVLGLRMWCRDREQAGINHTRRKRYTMEKESAKWLWGLEQAQKLSELGKEVVLIGDRESDIYDLFASEHSRNIHILTRVSSNRIVKVGDEPAKVFDALDASRVLGTYTLELPKDKRVARLEVRSCLVQVPRPQGGKKLSSRVLQLWAVDIREIGTADGLEPLHWRLLTTLDASSFEQCRYIADCYSARWTIEEFHRTLKTGCRAERLQFETVYRLRPAIAMLCVVAVQVMYLTRYARSCPDAPVTNVASEEERETVQGWVQTYRYKKYTVSSVADYVRGIGFIGGFRGRKADGEPGAQAIWQGLRSLANLVAGRRIERSSAAQF